MNFGEAVTRVKAGAKITRRGWNGKGMFVVYQKGYPSGIPCNKQTAEAWGLTEGDLFRCEPYLQIKMANGSHAMWVPSINDVLAEDWEVLGEDPMRTLHPEDSFSFKVDIERAIPEVYWTRAQHSEGIEDLHERYGDSAYILRAIQLMTTDLHDVGAI